MARKLLFVLLLILLGSLAGYLEWRGLKESYSNLGEIKCIK